MDTGELIDFVRQARIQAGGRPLAPLLASVALRSVLDERCRDVIDPESYDVLCSVIPDRAVLMQFSRMQKRNHERVPDETLDTILSVHVAHADAWDWMTEHRGALSNWFQSNWTPPELHRVARHRREHVREMQELYASAKTYFLPADWYRELDNTFILVFMAVLGPERYEEYRSRVNEVLTDLAYICTTPELPKSSHLN